MSCQQLSNECNRLRNENIRIENEIKRRMRKVRKQKRLLDMVRQLAWHHMCEANKVLSKKSGVPRQNWAKAKGGYWAAATIYEMVKADYTAMIRELL